MEDSDNNAPAEKESEKEASEMAVKEQRDLEAAKKERMELIAAEQKALASQHAIPNQQKATLEEKFHYLVSQSEVFAHFLAGESWLDLQLKPKLAVKMTLYYLNALTNLCSHVSKVRSLPWELKRGKEVIEVKKDVLQRPKKMHSS